MDDETTTRTRHTDKKLHGKNGSAGVRIEHRTGDSGYVAYCRPLVLTHTLGPASGYDTLCCRIGDSVVTILGRNLQPLMDDLCTERCALLKESELTQAPPPILPYLATITLQPWL